MFSTKEDQKSAESFVPVMEECLEDGESEDEESDYYDSSEDYDSDNHNTSHHKTEEEDDSELIVILGSEGDPITDDDFISKMYRDKRPMEEKKKLLPKIRRWYKYLDDTEGFDVKDDPNVIGLCNTLSRQALIDNRERYPEGYNHLMYLSSLALKDYNREMSTGYNIVAVEKATVRMLMDYTYRLTFTASSGQRYDSFRAIVSEDLIDKRFEVLKHHIHINDVLSKVPDAQSYLGNELCENDEPEKDPVKMISNLKSLSSSCLLDLIRNDPFSAKYDAHMLLKKLQKYFDSVVRSEGFECSHFPGYMPGLTYLKPREKIIEERPRPYYPEFYNHLMLMARISMNHYFGGKEHLHEVISLEDANLWKESSSSYVYYLTFEVVIPLMKESRELLQAKVMDKGYDISVLFCRKAV